MNSPHIFQGAHLDYDPLDMMHLHQHQHPHLGPPVSYARPHQSSSRRPLVAPPHHRPPFPRLLDCSPSFLSPIGYTPQQYGASYDPSPESTGFKLINDTSLSYYGRSESDGFDWSLLLPPPSTSSPNHTDVYGGRPSPGLVEPEHFGYDISPSDSPHILTPRTLPSSLPMSTGYSHPYRSEERRSSLGHYDSVSSVPYPVPGPAPPEPRYQRSPASSSTSIPSPTLDSAPHKPTVKECAHCHTTTTPLWRREPVSMRLLCNACGLYLQQHRRLRPQQLIDADSPLDDDEEEGPPGGPECSHCKTRVTTVWRRNKDRDLVCNACGVYQRMRGKERPLPVKRKRIKPRPKVVNVAPAP